MQSSSLTYILSFNLQTNLQNLKDLSTCEIQLRAEIALLVDLVYFMLLGYSMEDIVYSAGL